MAGPRAVWCDRSLCQSMTETDKALSSHWHLHFVLTNPLAVETPATAAAGRPSSQNPVTPSRLMAIYHHQY